MKYNQIETTLQDDYNNAEILELYSIAKKYNYTEAAKIINHSTNIIDAYIRLSQAVRTQDIIVMLAITKDIIFEHIVCNYTERAEGNTVPEPIILEINKLKVSDLDRLDNGHRQQYRQTLYDLEAKPLTVTPWDHWQKILPKWHINEKGKEGK